MTVAEFDDRYDVVADFADNEDCLSEWTLQPRGSTALHDAIGKTVVSVGERLAAMPEDERPGKVIGIIVTDGHENSSQEWSGERIKALIEQQTNNYGWQFIYTAANQDAVATGGSMGFAPKSSMNYQNTGAGTRSAYQTMSSSVAAYRAGSTSSVVVPPDADSADAPADPWNLNPDTVDCDQT